METATLEQRSAILEKIVLTYDKVKDALNKELA